MEKLMEYQKVNDELEEVITLCLKNLKGLTAKEELNKVLPVKYKNLVINYEDKKIAFYKDKNYKDAVWTDSNFFSNFLLLKKIGEAFGITCEKQDILSLMKFKMKIELLLCSEGVRKDA